MWSNLPNYPNMWILSKAFQKSIYTLSTCPSLVNPLGYLSKQSLLDLMCLRCVAMIWNSLLWGVESGRYGGVSKRIFCIALRLGMRLRLDHSVGSQQRLVGWSIFFRAMTILSFCSNRSKGCTCLNHSGKEVFRCHSQLTGCPDEDLFLRINIPCTTSRTASQKILVWWVLAISWVV